MDKLTSLEHAAAAFAALLITWAAVAAVANLGYPATAPAGDIAAGRGGGNAIAIAAAPRPMASE